LARRPAAGERLQVGAKELAKLLGHLVFGSQVVPGGRTYMQAMLSSFAGLEVDWRRGAVRRTGGNARFCIRETNLFCAKREPRRTNLLLKIDVNNCFTVNCKTYRLQY
jgi:hypothetical protein